MDPSPKDKDAAAGKQTNSISGIYTGRLRNNSEHSERLAKERLASDKSESKQCSKVAKTNKGRRASSQVVSEIPVGKQDIRQFLSQSNCNLTYEQIALSADQGIVPTDSNNLSLCGNTNASVPASLDCFEVIMPEDQTECSTIKLSDIMSRIASQNFPAQRQAANMAAGDGSETLLDL